MPVLWIYVYGHAAVFPFLASCEQPSSPPWRAPWRILYKELSFRPWPLTSFSTNFIIVFNISFIIIVPVLAYRSISLLFCLRTAQHSLQSFVLCFVCWLIDLYLIDLSHPTFNLRSLLFSLSLLLSFILSLPLRGLISTFILRVALSTYGSLLMQQHSSAGLKSSSMTGGITASATASLPFPPLPPFSLASITSPPPSSSSLSASAHVRPHTPQAMYEKESASAFHLSSVGGRYVDTNLRPPSSSSSSLGCHLAPPRNLPPYVNHDLSPSLIHPHEPRYSSSSIPPTCGSPYGLYSNNNAGDIYNLGSGEHGAAGYIRILPRTAAAASSYKKRCETCETTHDGSFGAGRFCSSRCARTVGGLAHRKKRLMERDAKQRVAAEHRAKIRKRRTCGFDRETSLSDDAVVQIAHDVSVASSSTGGGYVPQQYSPLVPAAPSNTSGALASSAATTAASSCADSVRSPRTVITINSLLNPAESWHYFFFFLFHFLFLFISVTNLYLSFSFVLYLSLCLFSFHFWFRPHFDTAVLYWLCSGSCHMTREIHFGGCCIVVRCLFAWSSLQFWRWWLWMDDKCVNESVYSHRSWRKCNDRLSRLVGAFCTAGLEKWYARHQTRRRRLSVRWPRCLACRAAATLGKSRFRPLVAAVRAHS